MTSYATPMELRAHIGQDTADDTNLQTILDAATSAIDRHKRRPDGFLALAAATARTYCGSGTAVQRIDDCVAVTAVAVKDSITDTTYTAWLSSDYITAAGDAKRPDYNTTPINLLIVDPNGDYDYFTSGAYNDLSDADANPRSIATVQVTARWGYAATTPPEIKLACIMQAARFYQRLRGSMADTVGSPDFGTAMYLKELDPDIARLLNNPAFNRMAL